MALPEDLEEVLDGFIDKGSYLYEQLEAWLADHNDNISIRSYRELKAEIDDYEAHRASDIAALASARLSSLVETAREERHAAADNHSV